MCNLDLELQPDISDHHTPLALLLPTISKILLMLWLYLSSLPMVTLLMQTSVCWIMQVVTFLRRAQTIPLCFSPSVSTLIEGKLPCQNMWLRNDCLKTCIFENAFQTLHMSVFGDSIGQCRNLSWLSWLAFSKQVGQGDSPWVSIGSWLPLQCPS
jgi:hypothetical protein